MVLSQLMLAGQNDHVECFRQCTVSCVMFVSQYFIHTCSSFSTLLLKVVWMLKFKWWFCSEPTCPDGKLISYQLRPGDIAWTSSLSIFNCYIVQSCGTSPNIIRNVVVEGQSFCMSYSVYNSWTVRENEGPQIISSRAPWRGMRAPKYSRLGLYKS